jgi:hypothetical protein
MTAALALLPVVIAACGSGRPDSAQSPVAVQSWPSSPVSSASASSASPVPSLPTGPSYGVLMTLPGTPPSPSTVSIVASDGRIVASQQATLAAAVVCTGDSTGFQPLPVSTSNDRAYFMDSRGFIRYLSPDGGSAQVTTVPIGATRRSLFSVSPDDRRIAVAVVDFSRDSSASTRLYIEDLAGGGHHLDLVQQTSGSTLWPLGWHGADLVVASMTACFSIPTLGPWALPELDLLNPDTGAIRFGLGGTGCLISGPPSPAGAVCATLPGPNPKSEAVTWASSARSISPHTGGIKTDYLSPDGQRVAEVYFDTVNTPFPNGSYGSTTVLESLRTFKAMPTCGWIDDTHIFSGTETFYGASTVQAEVADVLTGAAMPITARGDCAGRIPGGL